MKQKQRKRKKKISAAARIGIFFAVFLGVLVLFAAVVGIALAVVNARGRSSFAKKQEALPEKMVSSISENDSTEESGQLEAGSLRYQGKTYTYKEDLLTFLCMGIDKGGEVKASSNLFKGGQADTLMLAVLDPGRKEINIIGINRNTMTEINTYDRNGLFAGKEVAQLALAHAYGEGLEESCENTVEAVSNLFYGLPIHGYCALNMDVVSVINDAVGGVDVVIPESAVGASYTKGKKRYTTDWQAGDQVHLQGEEVYAFIRYRDTAKAYSADERLERQKQYLNAFIQQAKAAMLQDMTLPLQLYTAVTPYMVTNITLDEAVYLAGQALSYSFDSEHIYSMQGETQMGEQFEEFYPDDKALYEMILEVFYEEK